MALQIPNEKGQPNPGPKSTNSIESRLMAMSTEQELQRELNSVRANYQRFNGDGDQMGILTQTRLAQIIHLRANQIGVTLR